MPFIQVFQQTEVAECLREGSQALRGNASCIQVSNPRHIEGSVDIDSCLQNRYPQEHRWDYAVGYNNQIFYIEVHTASNSEVPVVIDKLNWLRDWLNRQRNAEELFERSSFHWITRGKVAVTKTSRYGRQLTKAGLPSPRRVLII